MIALKIQRRIWMAVGIIVAIGLWHALTNQTSTLDLPPPLAVAKAGWENFDVIRKEIGVTLLRAATSFLLAAVTMIPLGIACARIKWLGRALEPVIQFIVAIPPPAIVPIAMLFAGTGDLAKICVVSYAAGPLMLINTIEGVRNSPPMLDLVGRSLRLTPAELMRSVDLPAALPAVFTGVRLAIGASLLVSITSEMLLATDGIGTYIQRSQENYNVAATLSGIAVIAIVGLCLNAVVQYVEKRLLFWYYRHD